MRGLGDLPAVSQKHFHFSTTTTTKRLQWPLAFELHPLGWRNDEVTSNNVSVTLKTTAGEIADVLFKCSN